MKKGAEAPPFNYVFGLVMTSSFRKTTIFLLETE